MGGWSGSEATRTRHAGAKMSLAHAAPLRDILALPTLWCTLPAMMRAPRWSGREVAPFHHSFIHDRWALSPSTNTRRVRLGDPRPRPRALASACLGAATTVAPTVRAGSAHRRPATTNSHGDNTAMRGRPEPRARSAERGGRGAVEVDAVGCPRGSSPRRGGAAAPSPSSPLVAAGRGPWGGSPLRPPGRGCR